MTPRYAVVLTHNRPEMLRGCVDALAPQVDAMVVIDNASEPPVSGPWPDNVEVIYVPDQPPNLSRFWNLALDRIASRQSGEWDVALICDDVVVPDGWFDRVATAMRAHGASAASAHSYAPIAAPYVLRELTNGTDRMCPWAFMLPGEQGLRADETLRWWYCDTDLDWQARRLGGTLIVPGPAAPNGATGDWTIRRADLGAQTAVDGEMFTRKWGAR